MKEMPTIRAYGIAAVSAYPFKEYVYRGDQPYTPPPPAQKDRVCSVDDCAGTHHAKGYCSAHYLKHRTGTPIAPDNRRKPFDESFCGTTRGYKRHRHHQVPMCQPCRDAKNKYDRERRARTGAKK